MASVEEHTAVWVHFDDIDPELRPASQMRVTLNAEAVASYQENLKAIEKKKPVLLYFDKSINKHWVADGCHTITAARNIGRDQIKAIVEEGSYLDAFHAACSANDEHGVRITRGDKKRRVLEALHHPLMGLHPKEPWTQSKIAECCCVVQSFVSSLDDRPTYHSDKLDGDPVKTVGKDGRRRRRPKPRKPKPEPEPERSEPEPEPTPEHEGVIPTPDESTAEPETPPEPSSNGDVPETQEPSSESPDTTDAVAVSNAATPDERAIYDSISLSILASMSRAFEKCPPFYRSSLCDDMVSRAKDLLYSCDDVEDRTDSLFKSRND